jgi:hypothetical protein
MEVIMLDLKKAKISELLEEVSQRGFISTKRDILTDRKYKFPRRYKAFKLGIISDTHYASMWQQPTLCHEAYKIFKEEGITDVLHAGDISDGMDMHKSHPYELFIHGADATANYIIENYPKIEGITTHLIGGN